MAARLGDVLFWASVLLAGAWLWLAWFEGIAPDDWWPAGIIAAAIILAGMASRYVLSGKFWL
jgi:hypothetical protein